LLFFLIVGSTFPEFYREKVATPDRNLQVIVHKDDVVIFNLPVGDGRFADLLRKK
jgi:hypothetical protein